MITKVEVGLSQKNDVVILFICANYCLMFLTRNREIATGLQHKA